jgi:predicted nucleic acid-binding protein
VTAFVVDASVAAKWYLPEKDETLVTPARRLLGDYLRNDIEFMVPDIFWPEFGNIMWKAARVGRITADRSFSGVVLLKDLKIPTYPSFDFLAEVLQIALVHGRTFYDSLYVALAVRTNTNLVTADERLANALAAHLPVKWLGAM